MRWPLILAAALGAAPTAVASGRPPITNGVVLPASDPQSLYVRTTFGLLVSHDNGCSFRWICERAIGYGGDFDPKYAVAFDGTIFATTFEGLRVSRDGGCTWTTATAALPARDPGNLSTLWIDAIEISADGEIWVATAESAGPNDVYSSRDNGTTFTPRGLHSQTIWWKSVKTARTAPERVYLTGYQVAGALPGGGQSPPRTHLRRSNDRGATWTEIAMPNVKYGATPLVLVAAVDPEQADTLMVVSVGANGRGDRVYRSVDAGATLVEVVQTGDPVRDVVFAADGSVYIIASTGSFRSTDHGATFAPLAGAPQLSCLGQRADGKLVGCGANWAPDFKALAVSADATSWDPMFRFTTLAGPLACPEKTTTADLCAPLYPALQQQFGATAPTTCPAPIVKPRAPATTPAPRPDGGCCSAAGRSPHAPLLLALAVLASVLRRRPARET